MSPTRTRRPTNAPRTPTLTIDEQHAEWLALLRPDGPFLTVPILAKNLPHGLEQIEAGARDRLRRGWAEYADAPDLLHSSWLDLVFTELLRLPPGLRPESVGVQIPTGNARPDTVLTGPAVGGGTEARLFVFRRPADTALDHAAPGQPTLVERAAQLCRDAGVPLALLTNGRLWVLVHARESGATGTAVFDADLWSEEPILARALATLLAPGRVLVPPVTADGSHSASLAGLFAQSAEDLGAVTDTLGGQVRQAVELLVAELARLDRESAGALLAGVSEREIYRAAMTVLMRLLFLLYAEQARLLPVTDPVYAQSYAAATLYDQLAAVEEEINDRRSSAWPRLVALFAAVHGGCTHPDLRIPAYGGSLFDPARFGWLARAQVTDRVVQKILDALLVLRHRSKAAERLSYAALDVEQIGHVYEGLLEYSCLRVDAPYVGLIGKREPELPLANLEAVVADGEPALRAWLVEQTGATANQIAKARDRAPSSAQLAALHAACDNDAALADRVTPYFGLLRLDLRDSPTVFPAGSVLFTQVGDRRATGTHYTPRTLAEEVVKHTLAPLCFSPGPAQGETDEGVWRAKTADELLELKIVDPAMGSGAFLVSACRYLADAVVEAWDRDGLPPEAVALAGADGGADAIRLAAQRMVAARCLYGVDRDYMAVELAKLSLWLITLAKDKPFGFLDHALRCGDSLIGITSIDQLTAFHLDPAEGRMLHASLHSSVAGIIEERVAEATTLRERIEGTVVRDLRDAAEKARLLAEADALSDDLRLAADAVVGAALATAAATNAKPSGDTSSAGGDADDKYDNRLVAISAQFHQLLTGGYIDRPRLTDQVAGWLRGGRRAPIRPLHWPLEFPEVIRRGGFDALVSNPPFSGGQKLTGNVGSDAREYWVRWIADATRGSADICTYFLLRGRQVASNGRIGIIATNTIGQGKSRVVGLDQLATNGRHIYRAVKMQRWPGRASVIVSLLWLGHSRKEERHILDGREVRGITPSLDPRSRISGNPHSLADNANLAFPGSNVLGSGFQLEPEVASALIEKDPRNVDVIFPYLNGKDLNSSPSLAAPRWVINFHDWPVEKAMLYPDCFDIVKRTVMPERLRNQYSRAARERWWQYERRRPELYESIKDLERVLVIAQTSPTQMPALVEPRQVFDQKLVVFSAGSVSDLAFRSSSIQYAWTVRNSSTLKVDPVFTIVDCCDRLPLPRYGTRMDQAGAELERYRTPLMLHKAVGLTDLYNLVHDPAVTESEIGRLREIHVEIDETVAEAYGWDLDLRHGFHETRQGRRFTIDPAVQVEILDLLLELNFARHAEELRTGKLDATGRRPRKRAALRAKTKDAGASPAVDDGALFPPPDALF